MSTTVIKVENLGKQYHLGQVGTGTLSHDLNRWWHRVRGKEDPYLKLGDVNDRTVAGSSNLVWALKDVNFEVKQGEVLGIIGKNGAGKSTLLKILSKVTSPSVGDIKIKGRIASLLEVGTGFHPDLTGRENIFLNGAILGMTKQEIKKNFEEIVEFSGVTRYIDTPVKRYSSGMYVRLAFAVAAHLEPEILIIDEVLAVGDAEFQKKCLGKMKDVAGQGRTVLFVSHNLIAVQSLCSQSILMNKGRLEMQGSTTDVIEHYLTDGLEKNTQGIMPVPADWVRPWGRVGARFLQIEMYNSDNEASNEILFCEPIRVVVKFEVETPLRSTMFQMRVAKPDGTQICRFDTKYNTDKLHDFEPGIYSMEVEIDPVLMPGNYNFYIYLNNFDATVFHDAIANFFDFTVINKTKDNKREHTLSSNSSIYFYLPLKWKLTNHSNI